MCASQKHFVWSGSESYIDNYMHFYYSANGKRTNKIANAMSCVCINNKNIIDESIASTCVRNLKHLAGETTSATLHRSHNRIWIGYVTRFAYFKDELPQSKWMWSTAHLHYCLILTVNWRWYDIKPHTLTHTRLAWYVKFFFTIIRFNGAEPLSPSHVIRFAKCFHPRVRCACSINSIDLRIDKNTETETEKNEMIVCNWDRQKKSERIISSKWVTFDSI